MTFHWSEYLDLARELAQQPTDEAKLRSAISRAYYAAFIKSRNFLQQREGLNIPTENTHKYIINYFLTSSPPRRRMGIPRITS